MRARRFCLGLAVVSGLLVSSGCTPSQTLAPVVSQPAQLELGEPGLRPPALALPMHGAAIVGLELLPPATGEQWRLVSADAEGWVRLWADGRMLAAWRAHRGGVSDVRLDRDGSFYTAGKDGRVLRWPAGALAPDLAMRLGRPITALALADAVIGVSDGKTIELWTREQVPQRVWQMQAHGFVAGLELSRGGDIIAAAELRQSALLSGLANHPGAVFIEGEALGLDAEAQAQLRAKAELEHPEAVADFVEVWEPGLGRMRELVPQAPIDRELGIRAREGVVIYREIHGRETATLVGRRLADLSSVQLELVKPWAFWTQADGNPDERGLGPRLPAGDFRLGAQEEVVVLDQFPGYDNGAAPPYGWRVGSGRELAIDQHHAALGDDQGNLAVVAWARPAEAGWLAPGEARFDLLAAAGQAPRLVTATLEPRTHYRLWDLEQGGVRHVRVEAAWQSEAEGVAMFPTRLALDGAGERLATASSSYGASAQLGVRVLELGTGSAEQLFVTQALDAETGLELGLSQDAEHVLAWLPGSPARSWGLSGGEWLAGRPAFAGAPRFAANGHWSAHVSGLERHIVDLRARKALVALTNDRPDADLGANTLAALADDGQLALVQPFGGDLLEVIDSQAQRVRVSLPGAATALAATRTSEGQTVFVVGFADGSVARFDPGAEQVVTIHAGAGGRIWELAALASAPGVFIELDEQGLALHRLVDGASVELHLADPASLRPWTPELAGQLVREGLVAVWQRGSAQPPCRVLDASESGVLSRDALETWPRERAGEFFSAFLAGDPCA